MILEESPGTGYIYVIVLVTFIYCCVLYILHVSDKNTPRLGGFIYISVIIVHIHFQRICVTDIIMLVLRYIGQFIKMYKIDRRGGVQKSLPRKLPKIE